MNRYQLIRNLGLAVFAAILGLVFMPEAIASAAAEAEATVDSDVQIVKYISAAAAMGLSALAAGYAQAKIGTAAAGTLAEKPETATMLIVLQALPEIIVLLGFVTALIIAG